MNLYLLIIILMIELFVSFLLFRQDIISPAFIFSATFLVSAINLLLNVKYWNAQLHMITVVVVSLGVLFFIFGACISDRICRKIKTKRHIEIKYISISTSIKVACVAYVCFVMIGVATYLVTETGGGSLSIAISIFRNLSFTKDSMAFPTLLSTLYFIGRMAGYFWAYVLVNNYFVTKKIDKLILINLILSALLPLFSGERGSIIEIIIGIAILFLLYYQYTEKKRIKFRYVFSAIIVISILAFVFVWVGTFIGREVFSVGETFSIYLGAPLLNLDHWLQKDIISNNFWDKRTLAGLIDIIRPYFNNSQATLSTEFNYRFANGHAVGNVYTIFSSFYFDYGISGVIVFSMIMGMLIQCLFSLCSLKKGNGKIKFIFLAYSYPLGVLSFFGNRFFVTFNYLLIRTVLVWAVMLTTIVNRKIKVKVGLNKTNG